MFHRSSHASSSSAASSSRPSSIGVGGGSVQSKKELLLMILSEPEGVTALKQCFVENQSLRVAWAESEKQEQREALNASVKKSGAGILSKTGKRALNRGGMNRGISFESNEKKAPAKATARKSYFGGLSAMIRDLHASENPPPDGIYSEDAESGGGMPQNESEKSLSTLATNDSSDAGDPPPPPERKLSGDDLNKKAAAYQKQLSTPIAEHTASEAHAELVKSAKDRLHQLLQRGSNRICADCAAHKPTWGSTNLGVFLCTQCAGVHRSLGVHISAMLSAKLDDWTHEQLDVMDAIGNARANEKWVARQQQHPALR
jgi:stromal membrane-associated protein